MMHSYAAFLGHQPHLSIAELAALLPDFTLERIADRRIALFFTSLPLDADFVSVLGGTVILAKRITTNDVSVEDVPRLLANELLTLRGKVTFAYRASGVPLREVQTLYRATKEHLRKQGKASRYVGNEKRPAVSVLLHDAGLISGKHGCEVALIGSENGLWVGRTIGAQDVDSYSKRDMEKPVRDTTVGLLPPKLAQLMLNLGMWLLKETKGLPPKKGRKKEGFDLPELTVLDPFCGTGVIPLECLHRGWPVLASDLSLKAVNGCEKNLEWLRKEEKILKKDVPSTAWKQDAQKAFALKGLPDLVVTETSLGPSFARRPALKEMTSAKSEAEKLERGFLENAAQTLKGVPIVCTFPVWFHSKGMTRLERIWEIIPKIGYQAVLPPGVAPSFPGATSILYRRPDQHVGREMVLLKPGQ